MAASGSSRVSPDERARAQDERRQRIWQVINAIPPGRVCSYGEVARLAGLANGARQTAWALRHLPGDTRIPWYRVINSQGRIAMPVGSAGYREQRKRLEAEGVTFGENGRLSSKAFWWRGDGVGSTAPGPR
jgi:methylated-DNA-protein-cysteine methyltransferase-like protein